ncbi:TniQ family protein [Paraburkholderia youngii]|uniref:TniQ family protein n=1 Tax=Paraburkholderia youngii TaxID=2782701 RepID=UPI003D1E2D4E
MAKVEDSFLFLNRIIPEADITGYLVSQGLNRGFSSYRHTAALLSKSTSTRVAWFNPSGLRAVATLFSGYLPDLGTVIEENTRFYFQSAFLSDTDKVRLHEHFVGEPVSDITMLGGMNSGHFRGRLAMCPECVSQDRKEHGYAFWKRLHLMAGIEVCPDHERVLMTFCDACGDSRSRHVLDLIPKARCNCGGSLKPVRNLESRDESFSIRISSMAHTLMRRSAPVTINQQAVQVALRAKLARAGLEGRAPAGALAELLLDTVGPGYIKHVGLTSHVLNRFLGLLPELGPVRNPVHNVIAIAGVFGNWDVFGEAISDANGDSSTLATLPVRVRHVRHQSQRGRLSQSERRQYLANLPEQEFNEVRDRSREWLLTAVMNHPGITRTQLGKLPGADVPMRFFRCGADDAFYDEAVQRCAKGEGPVARLQREARKLKVIGYIRARHAALVTTQPEKEITRTILLWNLPGAMNKTRLMREPDIQDVLNELTDTEETWRTRVTALFCARVRRISETCSFGDEHTYNRLDRERFVVRLAEARLWLKANQK